MPPVKHPPPPTSKADLSDFADFGLISDQRHRSWSFWDVEYWSGGRRIYGIVLRELNVQDAVNAAAQLKISSLANMAAANAQSMIEDVRLSIVAVAYEPIPVAPVLDPAGEVVAERAMFEEARWTLVKQPFTDVSTWSQRLYNEVSALHQALNGNLSEDSKKIQASGSDWRASGTTPLSTAPAGGSSGTGGGRRSG